MDIKQKIEELSLDQKAKLYFMGLVRQGKIDRLPEDPKAAYVSMMMDKENKKPNLKSIADVDRSSWTPDGGGGSIGYMEWEDGTEMTPQEIQDYFEVNHELYDDIMNKVLDPKDLGSKNRDTSKDTTSGEFKVKIPVQRPRAGDGEYMDFYRKMEDVTIKYGHATGPLDDVTISWGNESHNVDFEEGDVIDDHGNEGKDMTFVAYSEDDMWRFIVDVSVGFNYEDSGEIQDVMWDTLEIDVDDAKMNPAIRSDFDDPVMELFINEQDADAKAYEAGLKRLQKGVIQFQLRYIQKQKSKAAAQAASATQEAGKGFDQQIKALQDQLKAIDNPPKKQQKESLLKEYIKNRANNDLMIHMDVYKQTVLLESTMKSLFKMFGKGKTNEEVLRHYAEKGITMPEQFLTKTRKQYENLKKQKLEIEFSEQEAKDILFKPTIPQAQLFDMGDQEIEEKQLASGILKNNKK